VVDGETGEEKDELR